MKQGNMSISEYRDKFIQLSRYAPEEVAEDERKQEHFIEGLNGPLQYALVAHTFPSFQRLLDKALAIEHKRVQLGDLKRKAIAQGQGSSSVHPFLSLKQGNMSVSEYRDKFIQLSRYAPEEVAEDERKQEHFIEGLNGPLQYALVAHTFPSFQRLLDKALAIEHKHVQLGDLKRKAISQGQGSSSVRPRYSSPQGTPTRPGGQRKLLRMRGSRSTSLKDLMDPCSMHWLHTPFHHFRGYLIRLLLLNTSMFNWVI